jgi:hypothetical protein
VPMKPDMRRAHDHKRDRRRLADHRRAKAAGVPGTPAQPHHARPNAIAPHITADNLTSPEVCAYVREVLARGAPDTLLRVALGVTAPAFAKLLDSPEFKAAYEEGHARAEQLLTDRLRDIALSDDRMAAPSAMFLLKTKHGYREKDSGARVQQTQNNFFTQLPQQQSLDDYVRSLPAATPSLPDKVPS